MVQVNLPFAEIQEDHSYSSRRYKPVMEAFRPQIAHNQA